MPQANTLWIGRLPTDDRWQWDEKVELPQIVDVDRVHPLMQWVETADTYVLEAQPLRPPQGSTVLIDSDRGPLLAIGPRDAFEDAVIGFELMGDDRLTSTWPVRSGFPVFIYNVLDYLGGSHGRDAATSFRPGEVVTLRAPRSPEELSIRPPDGAESTVRRDSRNEYPVANTTQTGVYEVLDGGTVVDRFAVNLLDPAESDIRTRPDRPLEVGTTEIESRSSWQGAPRAAWKYVLLAALVVLAVEWYIYNRRTYL
jgi:hypothetical protein